MRRSLPFMASLALLGACGTEHSSDDDTAVIESLATEEVHDEAVTNLINQSLASVSTCYDLNVARRGWRMEGPDGALVDYVPGRDALPQVFHLHHGPMTTKFNGFERLIEAGVVSAEPLREYDREEDGRSVHYFVYRLDFPAGVRSSDHFRINENQSLSDNGVTVAKACVAQPVATEVQYNLPVGSDTLSATFRWHMPVRSLVMQNMIDSGYIRPRLEGRGTAVITNTGNGWVVSRLQQ